MNEEIKEILNKLQDDSNFIDNSYCRLFKDETKKLLEHITNLQKDYSSEVEENLKLSELLRKYKIEIIALTNFLIKIGYDIKDITKIVEDFKNE